jgi:hypothetical protein
LQGLARRRIRHNNLFIYMYLYDIQSRNDLHAIAGLPVQKCHQSATKNL